MYLTQYKPEMQIRLELHFSAGTLNDRCQWSKDFKV